MPAATYTATPAALTAPVKYRETGVQARTVKYVGSANTVSDIILLMKLPDRTKIVDFYGDINSAETAATFKIGITGNETALGTFTLSAGLEARQGTFTPVTLSLTDGVEPHYGYLYATCSAGSFTTTFTLELTVLTTHEDGP